MRVAAMAVLGAGDLAVTAAASAGVFLVFLCVHFLLPLMLLLLPLQFIRIAGGTNAVKNYLNADSLLLAAPC